MMGQGVEGFVKMMGRVEEWRYLNSKLRREGQDLRAEMRRRLRELKLADDHLTAIVSLKKTQKYLRYSSLLQDRRSKCMETNTLKRTRYVQRGCATVYRKETTKKQYSGVLEDTYPHLS
jgi:hypothetical protein